MDGDKYLSTKWYTGMAGMASTVDVSKKIKLKKKSLLTIHLSCIN